MPVNSSDNKADTPSGDDSSDDKSDTPSDRHRPDDDSSDGKSDTPSDDDSSNDDLKPSSISKGAASSATTKELIRNGKRVGRRAVDSANVRDTKKVVRKVWTQQELDELAKRCERRWT